MFNTRIECQQIKAGTPASLGLMVEVTAPEAPKTNLVRKPAGIVFVVDRSGSMGGGRLDLVKQTILDVLGRLNKDDYLSVVTFDDRAVADVPMGRVGDHDLKALRKKIGEIQTGGSTNLEAGYRLGLAEASAAPDAVESTLILLSDGQANRGCVDADELGRLAAAATEHLVTTSTLGIGNGYDERILAAMANTGNGNHYAALKLDEAEAGLGEEIDGLLQRTISNLVIKVERIGDLADGSKVKTAQYGRTQSDNGVEATFNVGDLGSSEERNFVFELKTRGGNGEQTYAALKVVVWAEFYNELTQTQERELLETYLITQVNENDWVEPVRDEDIVMELATLRAADVLEEAMLLMRAGRMEEARELMRRTGQDLQQLEEGSEFMSARNRGRSRAHAMRVQEMAFMSDDDMLKKTEESLNMMRKSKPERKPKPEIDEGL